MRKDPFIIGEYYHIYNRGTDKRIIFKDKYDLERFKKAMEKFNILEPIGHIKNDLDKSKKRQRLVDFICYSLNPNHYHFILTPLLENGIEKFMHKLGCGYTRYFNEKYNRTGVLFQGRFKSVLIDSDEYLLYLSGYINLNNKIHFLVKPQINREKLFYESSWEEYTKNKGKQFCNKSIILDRFKGDIAEYKKISESIVKTIVNKRLNNGLSLDENWLIEKI